jgi:hypothetical protein
MQQKREPQTENGQRGVQPTSGSHPAALPSSLVGLCAAALGWVAGGALGSYAPRTACALGATALAFGLLKRRTRLAVVGVLAVVAVGLTAFQLGRSFVTPLLAYPAGALALGAVGAGAAQRLRTRMVLVAIAPLLGAFGFLGGYVAVFMIARALNDTRIAAEVLLGGAAGFGWLLLLGLAYASRRLDVARIKGALS